MTSGAAAGNFQLVQLPLVLASRRLLGTAQANKVFYGVRLRSIPRSAALGKPGKTPYHVSVLGTLH